MSWPCTDHVTAAAEDRVLRIRLHRPEKKNAITRDMYATMAAAIVQAADDSRIRVVLFEGLPGCFTAGNDLADFLNAPDAGTDSPAGRFLQAVAAFPKPLAAAVTGLAVGIGTTLLLHCDLVWACESATFQMPFVNLGLVPEFASSLLLPQLVGQRRASEMLMLGQSFDAAAARDAGLVNEVFPDEHLAEEVNERIRRLTDQPPAALRQTKQLLKRAWQAAIAEQMQIELDVFTKALAGPEAREALQAFMEKRRPDFSRFE